MKIDLSLASAHNIDISAAHAVLLIMYHEGVQLEPEIIEMLRKANLIKGDSASRIHLERLQYSFNDGFSAELDVLFRELVEEYPQFDRSRPLRDVSNKLRGRYLRKINYSQDDHKRVIEALKREKQLRDVRRAKGEFVESWKSLSKYVETEGWNLYPESMPEEKFTPHIGYGEQEL